MIHQRALQGRSEEITRRPPNHSIDQSPVLVGWPALRLLFAQPLVEPPIGMGPIQPPDTKSDCT